MTAILIWLSFVAAYPRAWRWWFLYGALILAILAGLHLWIDVPSSGYTIPVVWDKNTNSWQTTGAILYISLLFPLFALLYQNLIPRVVRMVAIVLIPYLILYALFAVWQETRLLMPVIIFGIPFARRLNRVDT